MNIGTGHWIFAAVFAVAFIAAITYAYGSDKKKSPQYFTGASRFLLGVVIILMTLIVVKILLRFS